ncbi:UNVERIFIED_CONTAM: hypothetical protein H355_003360 [Colinus virginianus]|nr:hypothetical protein H355_003360 [Colinus virginianus]
MAGLSRTLGIFGGFVAVVGAAFYPIYFRPLLLPDEYKREQSINRAGIVQENIQPPAYVITAEECKFCVEEKGEKKGFSQPNNPEFGPSKVSAMRD